jgi:hypothetical protein
VARKPYGRPQLKTFGKLHLQTQGTGGMNLDAMFTFTRAMMSDRRAKENVVRVGQHSAGIGLYLFDYKPEFRDACGHGRQLGVMADEVQQIMPRAVSLHPDGYKRVDYGMLGPAQPHR